jgi:starvation-inducible DNA-binding protein
VHFATRIDLDKEVRASVIELLNARLADVFDLYSQTKQAHWNVKGPQFMMLHELFDEFAAELLEYADTIAERATALGGAAFGTVRLAAAASSLAEFPADAFEGMAVVAALADRYAAFGASVRAAIDTADEAGDADTADLFTGVSRGIDKSLWFLEAHLQSK